MFRNGAPYGFTFSLNLIVYVLKCGALKKNLREEGFLCSFVAFSIYTTGVFHDIKQCESVNISKLMLRV